MTHRLHIRRAPPGRGAFAAAAFACACLPFVPSPAAADQPRMAIATSGGISILSRPRAENNGYYNVGDTIRIRIRFRDRSHHINFDDRICRAQNAYVNINIGGTWAHRGGVCAVNFEECYRFRGGVLRRANALAPSRDNLRGQTRAWGFVDFAYVVQTEDLDHNGIGVPKHGVKGKFWGCDPGGEPYHSYYYTDQNPGLVAGFTDQSGHKVNGSYRPVFRDGRNRIVRTGPDLLFRKDAPIAAAAGINYAVLPRAHSGTTLGLAYSVSPALPAGVRLTTDTGGAAGRPVLTGVPRVASPRTSYTLRTAADRNNRAAELPFTLEVRESPYVTGTSMASTPANGDYIYRAGETISAQVAFNQPVNIGRFCILLICVNTVYLQVAVGANTRIFNYASGSGTRKLTFNYTVQSDDLDTDGVGLLRLVKFPNAFSYIQSVSSGEELADHYYALAGRSGELRQPAHKAIPAAVTFGGRTIANRTLHVDRPVRFELPAAVGGVGALRYRLTPALPAGLRWTAPGGGDAHGGVIAGAPRSGTRRAVQFAFTARDSRGVEASLYFYLHVSTGATVNDVRVASAVPARGYYTKDDVVRLRATFNGEVASETGATLRLAVGATTHTLRNPARPPAGSSPRNYLDFSYTVQANDRDTDGVGLPANPLGGQVRVNVAGVSGAQTASLTLAALPDQSAHVVRGTQTTPDFGSASVTERTVTPANAVDIALPAASGGEGDLTYALTPAGSDGTPDLPAGLAYAPPADATGGGRISGRPAGAKARTRYTLTAADEDGDTDTVSFYLTATDAMPSLAAITDRVYALGQEVDETLPAATGGDGALTHVLTGPGGSTTLTLPPGLAWTAPGGGDAHGGTIAGSPRGTASGVYKLTATDVDGDEAQATFRIEAKRARVVVAPTALALAEGASAAYTVALSTPPAGTASITIESDHADVTAAPSPLTFTASDYDALQTVTVRAARDDDGDADSATLRHAVSGYRVVAAGAALSVTVSDTDTPRVTVDPAALTVPEGASRSYTVTLATRPAGAVTVSVASDNADVAVDTDSTPLARTLTFAPNAWSTPQTVTVSLSEDDDGVVDTAALSHAVSGYGAVATASPVTVTGVENDSRGLVLSPSGLGVTEGGSAVYTVALATQPAGAVTVTVTASGDSDVTIDTDSTPRTRSLTFSATTWSAPQTVTVSAAADADAVNDTATLAHATTGYASVEGQVRVTVTDTGAAGLIVSPTRLDVNEASSARYTVALATRPNAAVTVTVTASGDSDVTVDTDSTPRVRSLTFSTTTWSAPQTVTVRAAADDDAADDTATLGHQGAGGGYGSATASVSVAVADDDTPSVIVTPAALTVAEGMSATYTARLATQPAGAVTVTAAVSGDSDVTVDTDSTPRARSLTFSATTWSTPQTVTVRAASDDDGAPDRATVSHAVAGYGAVTAARAVAVTVTDDETPGVTVSATGLTVPEGGTAAYTVALNTPPVGTATVRIASDNGEVTMQSGAQTAAQHLSLTFTAADYATAQTVTVSAARDDDADADTATLSHAVTGYGAVTSAGAVAVTVTETDTNTAPGFGAASIANQDWRTGKTVALPLPAASGGNGALRYALTPLGSDGRPDLPGGLRFDAVSRLISGSPTAQASAVTYTYTVQDADSDQSATDSASLTFSIAVKTNSTPTFAATMSTQRYKRGTAVGSAAVNWVELPAATGGNPPVVYTLEGPGGADLPDGLAFTASTRRIAGTPSAVTPAATYVYTATDSDGDTATQSIVVRVVPNTVVTFPSTASVAAQTWMAGTQIAPLSLPEASGGDGALTYTLEGPNGAALPGGLVYTPPAAADHHGGVLSGAPEAVQDATTYTLTATDTDGDTAALTFTIAVTPDSMPSFAHVTAPTLVFKTTKTVSFTPSRALGGDAPVTYALTGPGSATSLSLPDGLSYRQGAGFPTGRIEGAPTGVTAAADYTLTATDDDGDTATLTISLETRANRVPAFSGGAVTYRYQQWRTLDPPQVLPAATGGDGAIAYEALASVGQPSLPRGLTYTAPEDADDGGGVLSGAPEETGTFRFRLDATDEDGDRPPSSKSVTIIVRAAPAFQGAQGGSAHSFVQNRQIDPLDLPGATGGDGTLTYTLEGSGGGGGGGAVTGLAVAAQGPRTAAYHGLPQGLTWTAPDAADGNGGTIQGLPVEVMIETVYRLTATDEDGDSSTFEFTVEVEPNLIPDFGVDALPARHYVQHREIAPLDFPDPGGSLPVTYVLEDQTLPAGLVLDEAEGVLSGTPTEALPRTTYTLTVVDRNGDRDTLAFTIEVESNLVPSFGDAAPPPLDHVAIGKPLEAVLPPALGGDLPLTWRLEPDLPPGLVYTAPAAGTDHGGAIAGTPTELRAATAYRLTATDANGDAATLDFTVQVEPNLVPSFGDAAVPAQRWRAEIPIQPLVLPAATGGNGRLAYTLAPDPPAGLAYIGPGSGDRHGGIVDGTPAAESAKARYTLTARDLDGDETSIAFTIEILASVATTRGRALERALAGFGRTVAAGAVEAIGGRFEGEPCGPEDAAARAPPGGVGVPLAARVNARDLAHRRETPAVRELLSRSAFDLRQGGDPADGCGAWSVWGRGAVAGFSGPWAEGEVTTGYLGAEVWRTRTLLFGMAVSHSAGDVDYDLDVDDVLSQGAIEADLTSVLPYAHWSPREGLGLWGLLGAGRGGAGLSDAMGTARTDIEMRLAAAGGRDELFSRPGASLALKADAFAVTVKSDAATGLAAARGDARRLRLALEGRADLSPLEASLELGGRWDAGDAGSGLGMELGGGLAWRDDGLGLAVDLRGHYLLAHQEDGFAESGASVALSLDPGVRGRGFSLTLAPAWGAAAGGADRLWSDDRMPGRDGATGAATEFRAGVPDRLELELAYGAPIPGLPDPLVFYGALSEADRRRYRLGGRIAAGEGIEARLELDRTERTADVPSHGILFELRLRH